MTSTDPEASIRVIKFGGSLLDYAPAISWLRDYLDAATQPCILICGGGKAVDDIRIGQQKMGLTDQQAHWRAVQFMDLNLERVAAQTGLPMTCSFASLLHSSAVAFQCHNWLQQELPVPESWVVSSDSIAAVIAGRVARANKVNAELVLLKSRLPDVVAGMENQAAIQKLSNDRFVEHGLFRRQEDHRSSARDKILKLLCDKTIRQRGMPDDTGSVLPVNLLDLTGVDYNSFRFGLSIEGNLSSKLKRLDLPQVVGDQNRLLNRSPCVGEKEDVVARIRISRQFNPPPA